MKINDQSPAEFLRFWRPIPYAQDEEFTTAWKEKRRGEIDALPDDALAEALLAWQRLLEDSEAVQASVRSRSANLLAAIGILAGLGALSAGTLTRLPWPYLCIPMAVALAVAWTASASAYLAVRAQQVSTWHRPHLRPREVTTLRQLRVTHATDVYSAARRNSLLSQAMVGYLRDAQTYALAMVASLATLVVVILVSTVVWGSQDSSAGSPDSPSQSSTNIAGHPCNSIISMRTYLGVE